MRISRDWATPITLGAFGLSAVTGVLLFFHLDTGLNKLAHEWLSWALLAAVVLHGAANFPALRRHLAGTRGRLVIGAFALALAASFGSIGAPKSPPWAGVVRTLAGAPLPALAAVAGLDEAALRERLAAGGVRLAPDAASLAAATGPELRPQLDALRVALRGTPGR